MNTKEIWKKIGLGILFVLACFLTMYILVEYSSSLIMLAIASVVLLLTAFFFLNAIFLDKAKEWTILEESREIPQEEGLEETEGEYRMKSIKHMKKMEDSERELIELLKNQNALLQKQIDVLKQEMQLLSEKQINQTKMIIKYNKENARQLAINERETLEYVLYEIKNLIGHEDTAENKVDVMPQIKPEMPFAEEKTTTTEETVAMEETVTMEEEPVVEETVPDLDNLFATEEPVAVEAESAALEKETIVAEEDPLATLSSDPNAMMTPEDIAKLLEAMNS